MSGKQPLVRHQDIEYNVMAYCLVNAPSFFQSFMNDAFWDILNCFIVGYIDILIYSRSFTEHVAHVRKVLHHLLDHSLYAKAEKCKFHKEIAFLGYCIGPEGVKMETNKVSSVTNGQNPLSY